MEFQTKIILLSLVFSCIIALIVIPILKKIKSRTIRKKRGTTITFKKTRNTYNGWNYYNDYITCNWSTCMFYIY